MIRNKCLLFHLSSENLFSVIEGEYIAPEKVENVYLQSPFVAQCYVDGNSLEVFWILTHCYILKPFYKVFIKYYLINFWSNIHQRDKFVEATLMFCSLFLCRVLSLQSSFQTSSTWIIGATNIQSASHCERLATIRCVDLKPPIWLSCLFNFT